MDAVTTVSPTYAQEMKTPEYGYGLDGVLRWISRDSNKLVGILNGIDYEVWNPETDKARKFSRVYQLIPGKESNIF